ncbi:hypothetical protein B1218_36685, partial [Pseudomonas ogarae]
MRQDARGERWGECRVGGGGVATRVSEGGLVRGLGGHGMDEGACDVVRQWMVRGRRGGVVVIRLLADVSYRLLGWRAGRATIGQSAFAAVSQLAPAMLGALYW